MAVKVQFEIGHAAKLKSKKTPEGFTHDWELFVKGTNKHDISHFVEKVVFNLHDSFPKPKRVIKDAPYVLKESGYAGFNLPIDIYFKNRDEPKRVTYNYDLSLQNTGPPSSSSQFKKFVFNNPSDEFRRKLLKGGGVPLVNALDEKSRDSNDALLTKQKINSDVNKKHKIRPDDTKTPTFDTLFGPPITKTTKVSPDPKNKSSPNVTAATKSKSSEKALTPSSSSSKEKSEKKDKKEKHKHSPHKEKGDTTPKETRKSNIEEKHERRDEKKKDKSHSKDRDRSKEKNLKRPASPKRFPSPKRSSPVRTIAPTTNRNDDGDTTKNVTRRNHSETSAIVNSNIPDKMPNSSSNSSSKKAKKEKKSHDKDKERERKEKDRERKEKEERPASSNSVLITPNVNSTSNSNITAKAATSETKVDFIKKESVAPTTFVKEQKEKKQVDVKTSDAAVNQNIEKKLSEKHDNKDIEKKHKHKKRDKAKEREKDKDYVSKEKKKEKSIRQKDDNIKKNLQGQLVVDSNANQKPNPLNTLMNEISEGDSSDSDDESHTTPSVTEKPENVVETSNSSMPDVVVTKPSPSNLDNLKTEKKERKSREKLKGEDRKRKRKSKEDNDSQSRKSTSPVISGIGEPASKQIKKDITIKSDKSMSPHVISQSSSISNNNSMLAPPTTKNNNADDISFRAPAATPTAGPSSGNNYQSTVNHDRSLTVDYMSELRELQKKIMTLQDNKELQQVVEMIAATGRFEVTSKTFDFDLCALDRHTVQRLQDFFATSCS